MPRSSLQPSEIPLDRCSEPRCPIRRASSMSVKTLLHSPLVEPEMAVWLRDITLDMSTTHIPYQNVRFNLVVRRKSPVSQLSVQAASWTQSRPFSEYSTLRKDLLRELQPGHTCSAECKWLYAVVKNHFPKTQTMFTPCSFNSERRRVALLRVLAMIQLTLVTHGNHGCQVLMGGVLNTFSTFLVGDRAVHSVSVPQGLFGLPISLGRRLARLQNLYRLRANPRRGETSM